MHILFMTYEPWPTYRPDVAVLFGKYLPALDVFADLVTETPHDAVPALPSAWGGGDVIAYSAPSSRMRHHLSKLWHNIRISFSFDRRKYEIVQVRDMSLSAVAALLAARLKGRKFFYWLSYLQFEGHAERARARGRKAGIRYWYPLMLGLTGQWILYKLVLPRADHVFVQSPQMRDHLRRRGVPLHLMTPVPMGVDIEAADPEALTASADPRLFGRRVLIYLGTQDRARRLEILFEMMALVRRVEPAALLVMAGDTEDAAHRLWLRGEAERRGIQDCMLWTGWLPTQQSWSYVKAAEIGLSPVPRSEILDAGSPTKALEYLALGVPVVGNDNPDQTEVIEVSRGGLCTPLRADRLAEAVLALMADPVRRARMGRDGRAFVAARRSYERIARDVARTYLQTTGQWHSGGQS